MELREIVRLIESKSGMDEKSLLASIDAKFDELAGLVTKEGAAYLIARQIGVDISDANRPRIKDVSADSRNVNVTGRIISMPCFNEFKHRDGSNGKVCSMMIADDTGQVRVTLWNDQTQMAEGLMPGDVIQLTSGMSKQTGFGLEVSLGKYGRVNKLDDTGSLPSLEKMGSGVTRSSIVDVKIGKTEIAGMIAQVLKGKFIYYICPTCGVKVDQMCPEHGAVDRKPTLAVSAIADDGTGDMKIVMFGKTARATCDVDADALSAVSEDERHQIIDRKISGKEFIFTGRVKQGMNGLEMIVENSKTIYALDESRRLLDNFLIGE